MRMEIYCDNCKEVTDHEMVKNSLYRCLNCGTHVRLEPEREVELKAIFSHEGETRIGAVKLSEDEELIKGGELIADIGGESRLGKITAVQLKDGRTVEFAKVKDSQAVWLKEVGEVYVRFSLHKRSVTSSYKVLFDGETEFSVGEEMEFERKRFVITRIKLIDGKILKKEGEKASAKEIKRIYATYSP